MKIRPLPAFLLILTSVTPAYAAVTVKTSIDVLAEVSTAVRIFVGGRDVTDSAFNLKLEDQGGYMRGVTPAFHFIGNAHSVALSLNAPANSELVSKNSDRMRLTTNWVRTGGGEVSTAFSLVDQTVYSSWEAVTDPQKGVKISFSSTERSENYSQGLYSGTFDVIVSPSV